MRSGSQSRSVRAALFTNRRRRVALVAVLLSAALVWPVYDALAAQPPVGLGTAGGFAVLAGSAVTNTGPSTLNGELGVSPGTAVTGFPPGTVNGAVHAADAAAGQAQSDLTTAYNDAAGRTPALTVSGDLGGLTLTSGVYKSGSSLGLTGELTLDAQGDPNAVFVFEAGSSLTTASASSIQLINGAQACNVYWQIGSSATLGTTSVFAGNILAYTSVSLNNGVTVHGRVLARNGAVTLINDTIDPPACTTPTSTAPVGATTTATSTTPGATTPTSAPIRKTSVTKGKNGTAVFTTVPRSVVATIDRYGTSRCVRRTFRVAVKGLFIRKVSFSVGGSVVANSTRPPFRATVGVLGGDRVITAHVTFTDGTHPARLHLRFRACAAAAVRTPHPAIPVIPSGFTG
jgi:Ice-binding-like